MVSSRILSAGEGNLRKIAPQKIGIRAGLKPLIEGLACRSFPDVGVERVAGAETLVEPPAVRHQTEEINGDDEGADEGRDDRVQLYARPFHQAPRWPLGPAFSVLPWLSLTRGKAGLTLASSGVSVKSFVINSLRSAA